MQRRVTLCGFDHIEKVPRAYNFSRFLALLLRHQTDLDLMFQKQVRRVILLLPRFGKRLAMDSKYIASFAGRKNPLKQPDGRRETDADLGMKKYHGVHQDGTAWEKVVKCFGFKLHLIVDATYDLPVCYHVTAASAADITEGHKLVEKLAQEQPALIETCDYLSADKGYDDSKLIHKLMDPPYRIKPVIDNRHLWRDEKNETCPVTRRFTTMSAVRSSAMRQKTKKRTMSCDGYEHSRNSLRKKCPVKAYGIACPSYGLCPHQGGIRIPLATDPRIFTAVDRSSYKFDREYDFRTSVERVNGRLDVSFGFEQHNIRGKRKMTMQCCPALTVMLTMAIGRIEQKQPQLMRSLVTSA